MKKYTFILILFLSSVKLTTNARKACGYIGYGYNGTLSNTQTAISSVEYISKCINQRYCCAAEFVEAENECALLTKVDDNEETTHSLYQNSTKKMYII